MNKKEAKEIIEIMLTADGECSQCSGNLIILFKDKFQKHSDLANKMFEEKYGEE